MKHHPTLIALFRTCLILGIALPAGGGARAIAADQSTVEAAQFGAKPNSGADATEGIRQAIDECRRTGATKLLLAPGRYDLWPDRACEKYLFVSNNDEGLRRIAFPLVDLQGLEIDGQGALLVFHGPMVPFLVEKAQRITIKNLSFDFVRPFHSEGRVLAVTPETVDLEFSEEFPFEIRHGILVFTGGTKAAGPATTVKSGETIYPYGSLLAFDPSRRETAYMAKDYYGVGTGISAQAIGPRRVRLLLDKVSAKPGNTLVFGAAFRDTPGFVITDSFDVRLSDVDIFHCGGMGVVAQRSGDLFLNRVRVTPAPGGRRLISITADATHFVNCRGRIQMIDCLFENQKDDASNIHGLYAQITRILAPTRFEIRLVHPQQAGIHFVRPGTRLELTQGASLTTVGYATVKSAEQLNKELTLVTVEAALPARIQLGDVVADADANTAEVLIKNCVMRGNRARGLLLGSRGRTVIEGNTFHIPGAAILFEGDGRFWFEQAGVRDVVIRGNTFDNCNFGVWGTAAIEVGAGIERDFRKTSRYNQNITIENNLFRVFDSHPLLSVYSVDGLKFRGNRIEKTTAYPPARRGEAEALVIRDSDRVEVEAPATASARHSAP